MNEKILNKCGIPSVVYIDDTIMILDKTLSSLQLKVAETYYELCGFKMSWHKRELSWELKSIRVLGVDFKISETDGSVEVRIPSLKIDEANSALDTLFEALKGKRAKLKEIE